jgi:uncharacterized Zn-finger protein
LGGWESAWGGILVMHNTNESGITCSYCIFWKRYSGTKFGVCVEERLDLMEIKIHEDDGRAELCPYCDDVPSQG